MPTSTDTVALNSQSTSTPSPSLSDKPSVASSDNHQAPPATIFKEKTEENQQRKISQLISENRLILKPHLRIDEVIKQLNNLKNNTEVVTLSAAEFDQMLTSDKDTKENSAV